MPRFPLLLIAVSLAWSASDDWHDVLARVRENVLAQVKRATNYTCVQTVDRTTFTNKHNLLEGCAYDSQSPDKKRYMHDRLRLDVAVSEGNEIFAWHGEGKFAGSTGITDVVRRGTISSGEFVGFLENIFGRAGIRFDYSGKAVVNGSTTYLFNYSVPLSSSRYRLSSYGTVAVVPFHGSFAVHEPDSQLVRLSAIADAIPENSQICSAETDMEYQTMKISGDDALIPSLFVVKLNNAQHTYTLSRSQYSECHAFKAEATVRFDAGDPVTSVAAVQPAPPQTLPARTLLHIGLDTSIDGGTSCTGDPIRGVLLRPLKIKGAPEIPKNALVKGLITMLEERDEPKHHFLLSIEFERLEWGNKTVLFRAMPVVSKVEAKKLAQIYGTPLPKPIHERYHEGIFVFASPQLHLDNRFSSDWIVQEPNNTQPTAASASTR
jgi:hypothetical protein